MTTQEVIQALAAAGCAGVSEWRVTRAIRCGYIAKPEVNSSRVYRWSAADFAAAFSWFKSNPIRKYHRREALAGA